MGHSTLLEYKAEVNLIFVLEQWSTEQDKWQVYSLVSTIWVLNKYKTEEVQK